MFKGQDMIEFSLPTSLEPSLSLNLYIAAYLAGIISYPKYLFEMRKSLRATKENLQRSPKHRGFRKPTRRLFSEKQRALSGEAHNFAPIPVGSPTITPGPKPRS